MGNCSAEKYPVFRKLNKSASYFPNNPFDYNLKKNMSTNNININTINTINNNYQKIYRISRQRKVMHKKKIITIDSYTNKSTNSKSKNTMTDLSDNNNNNNNNNNNIKNNNNNNINNNNNNDNHQYKNLDKNIIYNIKLDKYNRIIELNSNNNSNSNKSLNSLNLLRRISLNNIENNLNNYKTNLRKNHSNVNTITNVRNTITLNQINSNHINEKLKKDEKFFNNIYTNHGFHLFNNIGYKCLKTIQGHSDKIVYAIELMDHKIATSSYDSTIKIWNLYPRIKNEKTINEIGYSLCLLEFEKNMLLSGTNKNVINLYNLINLKLLFSFKSHESLVNNLVKINNKYFASCSNDKKIIIWDYQKKLCIKVLKGHIGGILSLIILSDNTLCSAGADLSIKIWDWKRDEYSTLIGHTKWIKCLCQLDNDYILSGSDDKSIKIWSNKKCIKTLIGHGRSVRTLCQINSYFFASGSFDKTIKVWDIYNFSCIHTIYGHKDLILVVIKISNSLIVSCSNDHEIKIWKQINK